MTSLQSSKKNKKIHNKKQCLNNNDDLDNILKEIENEANKALTKQALKKKGKSKKKKINLFYFFF